MMKLIIEANNSGYSTDQVKNTIDTNNLCDYLSQYEDNTPIYFSFNRGYTYGAVNLPDEEYDENEENVIKLIFATSRDGYGTDQIKNTITIKELINELTQYENIPVYLSFDKGYTYGGISPWDINEEDNEDEGE